MKTARTHVDPNKALRRPPYANKIIARIRTRQQTASDNATLLASGLTPPAAPLHGHGALPRKLAVNAYSKRLEKLRRVAVEHQAVPRSDFLASVIEDIEAGDMPGHFVPAPAHLQ